jgi:hypothetical protein
MHPFAPRRTIAQDKVAPFMTMVCPESSTGVVRVFMYLLHSTTARLPGRDGCVAAVFVARPALRLRYAWAGLCGLYDRVLSWFARRFLRLHLAKVRPIVSQAVFAIILHFLFVSELPR